MRVVLLFVCLTVPALGEYDYGNEFIPQSLLELIQSVSNQAYRTGEEIEVKVEAISDQKLASSAEVFENSLRQNGPLGPDTTLHLAGISDVILPGHGPAIQLSVEGPLAHKIKNTKLSELHLPYEVKKQLLSGVYKQQLKGNKKILSSTTVKIPLTTCVYPYPIPYSSESEFWGPPAYKDMESPKRKKRNVEDWGKKKWVDGKGWCSDLPTEAPTTQLLRKSKTKKKAKKSHPVPNGGIGSIGKITNEQQSGIMTNKWNVKKLHQTVNSDKRPRIQSLKDTMPLTGILLF